MKPRDVPTFADVSTQAHVVVFCDEERSWWKVIRLGVRIREVHRGNEDGSVWTYVGRLRARTSKPHLLRKLIGTHLEVEGG